MDSIRMIHICIKRAKSCNYFFYWARLIRVTLNPIKLDVFRCVPCYLHLMTPSTC